MTEKERQKILEAQREYRREYYRKNKEKVKAAQCRYWLKKALEAEKSGKEK